MFRAERKATVEFTPEYSRPIPAEPVRMAKARAARGVSRPRTSGLVRVLDIFASWAGSRSMLRAFAQALESAVPAHRLRRVSGERLMEAEIGLIGTGNSAYAVVVVRTVRAVSRGLDKERYVKNRWRRECLGSAADS